MAAPAPSPAPLPASATRASASARVTFSFDRPGLPVPKFTLAVDQNGAGNYAGSQAGPEVAGVAAPPATQAFDQSFVLSSRTAGRIFALSEKLNHFHKTCASKAKNIADTGTKTLTYAAPDGTGACTYNYSDNQDVEQLTTLFQAIAETMDEGRRLDHLHRYDRLGLDDAMAFLAQEVADGRALEPGTIAASLRSLAGDADVMERVRTRASALLAQIPGDAGPR